MQKSYITVQDTQSLKQLFDYINNNQIIALDTETTSLNPRKGRIVGWSVSANEGEGFYLPTLVWDFKEEALKKQYINQTDTEKISIELMKMLVGKKLVTHNGSFDCRYIKYYYEVDLIPYIWVDTTLLVHTVQEEGAGMGNFQLKRIAVSIQEELGLDVEGQANEEQIVLKQSIKDNGGSTTKKNFEIYKASLEILSKYGAADTDLTLRICNYFLTKLKEENLETFFFEEEVMPIYKEVTIPMEEAGVDLDLDLIEQTYEEIHKDLENNEKIVVDSLLKQPETKQWLYNRITSDYKPTVKGSWAQKLIELNNIPLPKSEKTGKYSLSKSNLEKLDKSNIKTYLLTGDITRLEESYIDKVSFELWKDKNEGKLINIQSKHHLGQIIFDYMQIEPLSTTEKGNPQLNTDMIEKLSETYEWAENLRVYNKLLKIKSTYIERFRNNHENGRYYPYFKQHGTVSGRYGSDLQQLPKPKEDSEDTPVIVKYNNIIRKFFIAGKGYKFIDADYTSLEPHCFASVTGDEKLREIFNKGWDFYSTVAIETEKLDQNKQTYPDGVSPDPKSDCYLKAIDPVKRNKAKPYSLGIAYGMEDFALSMTLKISQPKAKKLVQGYLNGFPGLKKWREDSRQFVKENGYIKNFVGRIRHLPRVKEIYDVFGDKILDWEFRKELSKEYGSKKVLQLYRDYKKGLNNCLNFQLQSLAASIVNRAALKINRKAKELKINSVVVAQIHDQLVARIKENEAEKFAPIVKDIMENNLTIPGVTLKAPPEIGENMQETH